MVSKNRLDSIELAKTSLSATIIKTWDEKISQAKTPKEKTALRADFKKNYNISFSQNLVKEIIAKENPIASVVSKLEPLKPISPEPLVATSTDPLLTPSPEANKNNDFETVQAEVRQASINLDDLVAQQKSVEDQEKNNNTDPELAAAAGKIDDDRDATVSATKDALDAVVNPGHINLSDAEKVEIELLDEKIEELGTAYIIRQQRLETPDLSAEEKTKLEEESLVLEEQMAEAISQKNAIKGIIIPEPEPSATPDSTPVTPEPEPSVAPDPTPPTPDPIVAPDSTPPTPQPSPEIYNNLSKFKKFNISEEDLKGIKEFSTLSEGQQDLVYEGLKQLSLVHIKDTARSSVENRQKNSKKDLTGDMSFWRFSGSLISNVFHGAANALTKKYKIAQEEKNLLERVKYAGVQFHKKELEDITATIAALNIDVSVVEGEPEVNYLQAESYFTPEQQQVFFRFNDYANNFREIPSDWALETASEKEQLKYEQARGRYEEAKNKALGILKDYNSEQSALLEINKVDSQVKIMQALSADPNVDKQFDRIEKQSAFRKMISGEASARGSYIAGGFIARHTLAGVIGFGGGLPVAMASIAAMPFAAAGVGMWRAHNQAKASLIDKDITGRKSSGQAASRYEGQRQQAYEEMNKMVPAEFSAEPYFWYYNFATEDQKKNYDEAVSKYRYVNYQWQEETEDSKDKTAKNFSDAESLTSKLALLSEKINERKGSWVDHRNNLYSLKIRIEYTEDKLADGLVNFGDSSESIQNKFEFIQALSAARTALILNQNWLEAKETTLAEDKKNNINVDRDLKERFEQLIGSKKIEFEKNLSEARKKYIIKQMVKGAGIGATFALAGVIVREFATELGIINAHGAGARSASAEQTANSTRVGVEPSSEAPADTLTSESDQTAVSDTTNISDNVVLPKIKGGSIPTEETGTGTSVVENAGSARAGNGGIENFSDDISAGDSVWRSTREIFKNHAQELGYKGDLDDATALSKWAETQTANTLHNTGEFTDKVFEGNKILLEKNSAGDYIVKVEAGTGATPGFSETAESLEPATSGNVSGESNGSDLADELKFQPGTGDSEVIPEPNKPLNFPEFFKHGNEETLTQIEKLGWKINGNNLDYGGKNVISFDDATKEIKITGDGGDGTRLLIIDKDGSMQGLQKLMGEFREVDMKTGRIIGSDATEVILKAPESASSETSVLASQNGFASWKGYIVHEKLHEMLSGRETTLDFKNNTFEYEWNGEKQSFTFQPGEAARANIEKFLAERGQIEKLADGIQNNLMTGKMKSFSALQNQLEEMNGATKLTEGEKNMWREIYADNFAKKSSSLLDDGQKLKVLRSAMNTFLSGGAK